MKHNYLFYFCLLQSGFVFSQPNCVVDISTSDFTISIFTESGKVYTYGENNYGQVGNGNNINQTSPFLRTDSKSFKSISHSSTHTVALVHDNQVYAWGANFLGQLGNNSTTSSNIPVLVSNDTDWAKVDLGALHTVALKENGTIWGWGNNDNFSLSSSNNPPYYFTVPIQLSPTNDWTDISAGASRTFAIKNDGTLWARGNNINYGLGLPSPVFFNEFTQVGTATNWKKVKSPVLNNFSIGLKTDNTLWGWGDNFYGAVGVAQLAYITQPTQIGTATWSDFAVSSNLTVGIQTNGTLWYWGKGALDTFTNTIFPVASNVPIQVGTENNWIKVATGRWSIYAVRNDNTVWAFDIFNYNYGVTPNTTQKSATPVLLYQCLSAASTNENELSKIIIYSNPTVDKIYWAQNIEIHRVIIHDVTGKIVYDNISNDNFVDVSNLSNGTYLIKLINSDESFYNSKFIKK